MNYNINTLNCNDKCHHNTWLHIQFKEDISSELGNIIPYPHYHYLRGNELVYCWLIDGFFDTLKGVQFLNDIIARFKITFQSSQYIKHSKDIDSTICPLKLRSFQGLKSKSKAILRDKYHRIDSHQDYVFMCLKLYAEDLIRQDELIIYNNFESWAFQNFVDYTKDRSTLRAKCRSIYNWYFERNWKIGRVKVNKTKEDIMASRQEHAKKIHTKLANDTKKKVLNIITGMFKDEYKKPNGSWNVSKIAKDSGTTRPTVMKYLPKDTLI